ncbi:MAG: hypothetical protein HY868_10640 [Chloroflexi bacterium]|nr:hypothetical protein [Chloroflexota bacterium]
MKKEELVLGAIQRGSGWGIVTSAVLGGLYGFILFFYTGFSIVPIDRSPSMRLISSLFVGSIAGAIIGMIMGLVLGCTAGLLWGNMVHFLTTWHRGQSLICQFAGTICVIYVTSSSLILLKAMYTFFDMDYGTPPRPLNFIGFALFYNVPILLAAIGAAFASQRLAHWYERESTKGIAQNVSPN